MSATTTPTTTTAPPSSTTAEDRLRAALATERPPRAGAFTSAMAFAWRGMLKVKHVPEQLIDATITPVLFLVMFTYLFGGAIAGGTGEYLQYLLPGMLVQSVLFTSVYSGVSLNTDVTKGVVDRFRTLPIWAAAPLVGAVAGDSARYLVAAAGTLTTGFVLGYDAGGGVLGVLATVALVVLASFALSWAFTVVGLLMRAPNAVMNTGFMVLFPIIFLSNIFVQPETLPGVLEWFVGVNPVSHLVTAARGLMGGTAEAGDVLLVLGEAAVVTAIFAPLTVKLYRGRG